MSTNHVFDARPYSRPREVPVNDNEWPQNLCDPKTTEDHLPLLKLELIRDNAHPLVSANKYRPRNDASCARSIEQIARHSKQVSIPKEILKEEHQCFLKDKESLSLASTFYFKS